jgi:hypothetical protein
MRRLSLVSCLVLVVALPAIAQNPKLDVATPQPPAVIVGNGTDAQQVMKVVGGKGGNSPDTSAHPGAGSSILIQAGDGGDGSGGMGSSGAGGSILLMPGLPGSFGDINGAAGNVGIGTLTPQKMLSVQGAMNIDQADANNGIGLNPGLSFGSNSGSGIASARSSFNPMGLDFYTNFNKRISITSAGAVTIFGTLSKGGGSFKIDHPLDPENKYLSHSFVESPDMKNIYDGVARLDSNGETTIDLPEWFEALNEDFRYQLTAMGKPSPGLYVADEIHGNQFRIAGGAPGAKVSWQVTGIRHDAFANAHRIVVEEEKTGLERGTLLYPKEQQMNAERAPR